MGEYLGSVFEISNNKRLVRDDDFNKFHVGMGYTIHSVELTSRYLMTREGGGIMHRP